MIHSEPVPAGIHFSDHRLTRADWLAVSLVTLVAGLLRFLRLSSPRALVFDEVYYARDACHYLGEPARICGVYREMSFVHPPLGKWIMAEGIRIFGFDSFGWRFMSALAGTITVALLYLVARKILRSTLGAAVASGLLAIDFLHFVHSRIAMLDVFATLLTVAAFLGLAYDREWMESNGRRRTGLLKRPWRAVAGIAAGLAVASKWSGAFVLAALIALTVVWEIAARRKAGLDREGLVGDRVRAIGWREAFNTALRQEGSSILLWLVAIPAIVYALCFAGRVDGRLLAFPWSDNSWTGNFVYRQWRMLKTSINLESLNSFKSPAWSWILLKRPFPYYTNVATDGSYDQVFGGGSPLVWWGSAAILIVIGVKWLRSKATTSSEPMAEVPAPEGFILAGFLFGYVPYLLIGLGRSSVYLFYMLGPLPFMCLAVGWAMARASSMKARALALAFLAGAAGLFAFFYPILADIPISKKATEARVWFRDCQGGTWTLTFTPRGRSTPVTKKVSSGQPPKGWCWSDVQIESQTR